MEYDLLLEQAKDGQPIAPEVLELIRKQLLNEEFDEDPYTLIHILGECGDRASLPLIIRYLDYDSGDADDDGMIRRIALLVYGRMWGMKEAFPVAAEKAFHDSDGDVRCVAATIIGFLAAAYPDLKVQAARLLLEGFGARNELEPEIWESFHDGLLELFDVPVTEWPRGTAELRDDEIRWDLVARANDLADGA